MKALSLMVPWAYAWLYTLPDGSPLKPEENRDWPRIPAYRGPLLIHASVGDKWLRFCRGCRVCRMRSAYKVLLTSDRWICGVSNGMCVYDLIERMGAALGDFDRLPKGGIIGKLELTHILPVARVRNPSPFAEGPLCLLGRDRMRLRQMVEYKGALGLFDVPDEVMEKAEWI
jgi:hypothetical protein